MYQTQKQHIDLIEQGQSKTYCSKKDWLNYKVNICIKFRVGNLLFRSFANSSPYRATLSNLLSPLFKKSDRERIVLVTLYKRVTRANPSLTKSDMSDSLVF